MASEIDIANRALSEIGTRSSISTFDDGSVEGYQAGLWYDDIRKRLLRAAPWGFARRQFTLAQVGNFTNLTSPYPFLFSYLYPADAIKFRYVLPPPIPPPAATNTPVVGIPIPWPFAGPSRSCRYLIMNQAVPPVGVVPPGVPTQWEKILVTNVFGAVGVYTGDVQDVALFDSLFEGALVSALAAKLVIPLSGNIGMKKDFEALADAAITQARVADGNESITTADPVTDWVVARGTGGYGNGPGGPYGTASIGADWGSWNCSYETMGWSS